MSLGRRKSPQRFMVSTESPLDWRSREYAIGASLALKKHLVGLRQMFRVKNETLQAVYSGFPLHLGDSLYWVSAGHCFHEIAAIQADKSVASITNHLVDNDPPIGAESIPLGPAPLNSRSIDRDGYDIGAFELSAGFAKPLLANQNVAVIRPEHWTRSLGGAPTGHFLLGFPNDWVERTDEPLNRGWRRASATMGIACFPVNLIPDQGKRHDCDDFWGCDGCVYGTAIPYLDDNGHMITTLKGMSGGLLIAFRQVGALGAIEYQLVGVQSSTLGDSYTIRATPVRLLPSLLIGADG